MKKLAILGGGESGTGAALLGVKNGFEVFVSDCGKIKEEYIEVLNSIEVEWEENRHDKDRVFSADIVVKSPGIPDRYGIVKDLRDSGVEVISEIEFGWRFTDARMVCVTGSNGKTTTTMLIYDLLKRGGVNVGIAGNMGRSFAWQVAEECFDVYVIELSSFQLDGMYEFRADVAVMLNITADHLDRYDYDMGDYVDSKFRIVRNQRGDDIFIYCADDPIVCEGIRDREIESVKLPFSFEKAGEHGAWSEGGVVSILVDGRFFEMRTEQMSLQGFHNVYNAMAAGIVGVVFGLDEDKMRQSFYSFRGVEHRFERCGRIDGVDFINDSKATNVYSSLCALDSVSKGIVWIAGGIDKGNDYAVLYSLARSKVKALVCLGKDNGKLHSAFGSLVGDVVDTESMEEAVRVAYSFAESGDTVLLSPACASFDLFYNYEDRGDQFKMIVNNLKEGSL